MQVQTVVTVKVTALVPDGNVGRPHQSQYTHEE